MSVNINGISINELDQLTIINVTSSLKLSYGRRFEVKRGDTSLCTTTMNELYKNVYTEIKNTNDKDKLKQLDGYLLKLRGAEILASRAILGKDSSCIYSLFTFWCRLFGSSPFFGTHDDKIARLQAKIQKKLGPDATPNLNPATPNINPATPNINPWKDSKKFTDQVYNPLPVPEKFKGALLTGIEFNNFLTKHKSILDEFPGDKHGPAKLNLERAFFHGKGYTNQGGEAPFFSDSNENIAFHLKVKETITLISNLKEPEDQQIRMRSLAQAFAACNTGRVDVIIETHDHLLGNASNPSFGDRIRLKINAYKVDLFGKMIRKLAPTQDVNTPIYQQIPHMTSGYKAQVGNAIGLSGATEAALDSHKYLVNESDKHKFINNFKIEFNKTLDQLVEDIAREINDINGSFNGKEGSFGTWLNEKVNNNELPITFAWYDVAKGPDSYKNLTPPSDDQKDGYTCLYISKDEVKQILGMLGYL